MRATAMVALLAASLLIVAAERGDIPFEKHAIDPGASETCAFADINGDGKPDIVSGENWYEAPQWVKHKYRTLPVTNNYIDAFSDLSIDVNGDGHIDIVTATWFAKKLAWWENPGKGSGEWKEHPIDSGFPCEFAFLVDLDNDGKARELLPQFGGAGPLAWYEISKGQFVKHVVSEKGFGHGIGAGDVNGDGRTDIITPKGWFEAPADPRQGQWKWRPEFDLGQAGFIHVLDINGDGRNDLLTSLAHDYGIFWMEQGTNNQWTKHLIDKSWSQAHAVAMADLNGDGRPDFITGKRYMAHNGKDPGEFEPLGVYWYEFRKAAGGAEVEWVRHAVDQGSRAGGGMQVAVADIDGDRDLDFAVGGKSGLFLFENLTTKTQRTQRPQR